MKFLHNMFDRMEPSFTKGGKHEKYYALFEMFDTFYVNQVQRRLPHHTCATVSTLSAL